MMDFSFIIPAYNEATNIERTIGSIKGYRPDNLSFEIVVVDHGSSDDTAKLAKACGASVFAHPKGTIAELRNFGVKHSTGSILVFLDADMRLTHEWAKNINEVARPLAAGDRILTGSWCSVPENPNWIEKYWFKPLERGDNSHINSGHMIVSRQLFEELGGFDETLETGEDYDISIRAKAANVRLIDDTRLKVVHEGYPKNLVDFSRREFWHGKGDASTLTMITQSKVAMVSIAFIALHLGLLFSVVAGNQLGGYIVLSLIAGITILSSSFKYRHEPLRTILVNSGIYYVYFWARGLSIVFLSGIKKTKKRTR